MKRVPRVVTVFAFFSLQPAMLLARDEERALAGLAG